MTLVYNRTPRNLYTVTEINTSTEVTLSRDLKVAKDKLCAYEFSNVEIKNKKITAIWNI
jgi:hypothetical protein